MGWIGRDGLEVVLVLAGDLKEDGAAVEGLVAELLLGGEVACLAVDGVETLATVVSSALLFLAGAETLAITTGSGIAGVDWELGIESGVAV